MLPPLPGRTRYLAALTASGVLTAVTILLQADGLATLLTGGGLSITLLVAIAARVLLTATQGSLGGRFAASVKAGLRRRLLDADASRAGVVATQVTRGADAADGYLTGYLPSLVVSAVVPVAVVARLYTMDLSSAVVVTVTLPLVPVFAVLVGLHTKARTARQWTLLTRLGGHFLDLVQGLGTLKLFGRAEAQTRTVRAMADAHADATLRTLRVAFLSALVLELVATLSIALVAVPTGFRLLDGGMTAHTAMLILVLAPEAYLPLRAAGAKFHAAAEGLTALREALATTPVPRSSGTRTRRRGAPSIEFRSLSVHHGGVCALSSVDLALRPGEQVALTGPSGAGKSTLLAVLMGFVAPTSGQVLIDGVDLREWDPDDWLADVAWVPQRPTLFRESLAANIGAGYEEAARAAALDPVAAGLPSGYATILGELGEGLSAGQRQRVGLARALARTSAGLLLLDEPTARLDRVTEATVLSATRRLLADRTALLVAHRPAMTALAGRVVELRAGSLVREGALAS